VGELGEDELDGGAVLKEGHDDFGAFFGALGMAMVLVGVAEVARAEGVGVALDAVDFEGAAAAFGFGLGWEWSFGGGGCGSGHSVSFLRAFSDQRSAVRAFSVQRSAISNQRSERLRARRFRMCAKEKPRGWRGFFGFSYLSSEYQVGRKKLPTLLGVLGGCGVAGIGVTGEVTFVRIDSPGGIGTVTGFLGNGGYSLGRTPGILVVRCGGSAPARTARNRTPQRTQRTQRNVGQFWGMGGCLIRKPCCVSTRGLRSDR